MKRKIFILLVGMGMLWLPARMVAQSGQDFIRQGDSAYTHFDNTAALRAYQQAVQADSSNYEALWKLSRAYVDVGETFKKKNQRKQYFREGEKYARRAVEVNPDGARGHVFLAVALGRVALDAGAKKRVRLSKEIRAEIEKALALDPNDDIAWHVYGRWHRKMATLSWIERKFANLFLGGVPKDASKEKAVECFQKAIELNPNHINHHLELAITYEKLKKKDLAIAEYEKVLQLPKSDADDEEHKAKAEKRLKKLKK